MARTRKPRKLVEIVNSYIRKKGYEKRLTEEQILTVWYDVAGVTVSANTRAVNFREGTLFVNTKTPAWAHELTLMERDLVSRINDVLGKKIVKKCRFSVGTLKERTVNNVQQEEEIKIIKVEDVEITEDLEFIYDEELREKFISFAKHQKGLALGKRKNGWLECPLCGNPFQPREDRDFCLVCTQERGSESVQIIKEILSEYPWLNYIQVNQTVQGVSENSYWQAKKEQIYLWYKEIDLLTQQYLHDSVSFDSDQFFRVIHSYVMLNMGLTPDQLSKDIINDNLSGSSRGIYTLLSSSGE